MLHADSVKSAASAATWPTSTATPAQLTLAFNLSWAVNILLFVVKLYAYLVSHSKAVLVRPLDSMQGADLLQLYCIQTPCATKSRSQLDRVGCDLHTLSHHAGQLGRLVCGPGLASCHRNR
jgi:hypothetical protein